MTENQLDPMKEVQLTDIFQAEAEARERAVIPCDPVSEVDNERIEAASEAQGRIFDAAVDETARDFDAAVAGTEVFDL